MADSITKASDAELLVLAENLHAVLSANAATYGVTPLQLTELQSETGFFDNKLVTHVATQTAALAATQDKAAGRISLEAKMRSFKSAAKLFGASEAEITALGIISASQAAPENATVPSGSVDTSVRLKHTISFADAASGSNKRKPRGAVGCEIWVKIDGVAPTDEKECTFMALDTKSPYVADFNGSQAGKMAHYLLRWSFKDGSKGGWGETVSATITG